MSSLAIIGLSILGIVLVIGIIRVIIRPSETWFDFFLDILLLDLLFDLLGAIIEAIFDSN